MVMRKVQAEQLDMASDNSEAFTSGGANDLTTSDKLVIADVSDGDKSKTATVGQVLDLLSTGYLGAMLYKGTWDASVAPSGSPTLPNPPGVSNPAGHYYIVTTGGTRFGLTFNAGDWIVSNGSAWQRLDATFDTEVINTGASTDNAIARFDGATGNIIQNSPVTVADDGTLGGVHSIKNDSFNTPPSSPSAGQTYFDSDYKTLMYYDAVRAKWLSIDNYMFQVSHDSNLGAGIAFDTAGGVDTSSSPLHLGVSDTCLVGVMTSTSSIEDWTLGVTDIAPGGSGTVYTLPIPSGTLYALDNVNQNFTAGDAIQIYCAAVGTSGNIDRPAVTLIFKRRK